MREDTSILSFPHLFKNKFPRLLLQFFIFLLFVFPVHAQTEGNDDSVQESKARAIHENVDHAGGRQVGVHPRIEVWNQWKNEQGSPVSDETVLRLDYGFRRYAFFRIETPFVYQDKNDGTDSNSGLGDITTRLGSRILEGPYFTHSASLDFTFDTAQSGLGKGKKIIIPGWESSATISSIHSVFTIFSQYGRDIGGDPLRKDINYARFRFTLDTDITKNWIMTLEPFLFLDWVAHKSGMVFEGQILRTFGSHYRGYIRGGTHIYGENLRGMYDWISETGIRYVF